MSRSAKARVIVGSLCFIGLAAVFIYQKVDIGSFLFSDASSTQKFIVNRLVRFFLNDLFAIGLIYAIFIERKYVIFALWVQLAGVILFLIPYLLLRYGYPSYNGPMISYLHRLILNPTLLLLLIPAFYYQKKRTGPY